MLRLYWQPFPILFAVTLVLAASASHGNNQRTGTGYAYDGNGNPTTYSSGSASYDEENRLTAFPAGAQVWGAGYRADGLRAWTRKTATGAKTYSYYDGGNAVLETKADGTMVGMNIFAPDGLVTRWSKLSGTIPVVGDYQFDWQGNAVHCLFSGARYADEPLIHSAYNAWGQRNFVYSNGAGSVSDLLRFGYNARWGYKLDTETGLYYCQHRYYDPANGRWVTRDPIGVAGGVNVYAYCSNFPSVRRDAAGIQGDTGQKAAALAGAMAEVGSAEAAAADAAFEVHAGIIDAINAAGSAGECSSSIVGAVSKAAAAGAIIAAPSIISDPVVTSPSQRTGGCPPCDAASTRDLTDRLTGGYRGEERLEDYRNFLREQQPMRGSKDDCVQDWEYMRDYIMNLWLKGLIGSGLRRILNQQSDQLLGECISGAAFP